VGVSMSESCRCMQAVVMEVRASNMSNATTQPWSVLHYCVCLDDVQSPLIHHSPLRPPALALTHSVIPSQGSKALRFLLPSPPSGNRIDRSCAISPWSTRTLHGPHYLEIEPKRPDSPGQPSFGLKMERQQTFQRVCIFNIVAGPTKLGTAEATMHSSPARHCCSGPKTRVQKRASGSAHKPA
jgi:hypothetical protein